MIRNFEPMIDLWRYNTCKQFIGEYSVNKIDYNYKTIFKCLKKILRIRRIIGDGVCIVIISLM